MAYDRPCLGCNLVAALTTMARHPTKDFPIM
jgi:hypothetical protein